MHIKFISEYDREARLANRRVMLVKDEGLVPDMHMDLIFHRGPDGNVFGFRLKATYDDYDETFTADSDKIDEELKACGFKTEAEKREWLEGIKKAEAEMWQAWMDGEVYGLVVQTWDADERQWKCVDAIYGIYGFSQIKMMFEDLDLDGTEVFCVDKKFCGDPKDWKAEFREFDI